MKRQRGHKQAERAYEHARQTVTRAARDALDEMLRHDPPKSVAFSTLTAAGAASGMVLVCLDGDLGAKLIEFIQAQGRFEVRYVTRQTPAGDASAS